MAYPLVKFVVEPDASPTVLLDCNTGLGGLRVPPDDFTLGAPDEDRFREVKFSVMIDASYTAAAAGVSALSRVLQRPAGWLMFQRDASYQPMFARWYRDESSTDALGWSYPVENTVRLPITLVCDEGLYAEPEVLAPVTIGNNPAGIAYAGTAAAAATSIAIPAHVPGDLIVIHAFRDGNNTPPSAPDGTWTLVQSGGANTCSSVVGYKIASTSSTTSGTWANATHLEVEVLRGVDQATPVGASANAQGSGTSISIPALTLQVNDGSSWVVGGVGHRTASTAFAAPSGMIQRARVGVGPQSAIDDTAAGVSSWAAHTVTSNLSSGWRGIALEIRAGSNRASYELPAIKGDMPTPLKIDIAPLGADWTGYQPFMASVAYDASQAWDGPIIWDLTDPLWTAGTDTGGNITGDGSYVGGSYRGVSFATETDMVTRLSGGPAAAPIPGTYKVLMRAAVSVDNCTIAVRLGQKFNLTQLYWGPTRTIVRPDNLTQQEFFTWIDLGQFTFPFGAQNLDLADVGVGAIPVLEIQAQRVSGSSGGLQMDALLLIPKATAATVDDSIMQTSRFHGFGLETDRNGVWDGLKQRFAAYNFGTALADIRQPDIRGGWLEVIPGANNVFHLLQQSLIDSPFFTTINDADVIAQASQASFSYLPRYRHLRPDTE